MQGMVFLGDRRVEFRDFPDPVPALGEVVIKIEASGMCGSDLHQYRAAAPQGAHRPSCIAGHEPAGVVFRVGPGVDPAVARIGDRVMVHHYTGCTTCDQCRSGWPQLCTQTSATVFGSNAHGSHAPYMKVPAHTLVPLADSLSFEAGAALACGTGTAWGGLTRLGDVGGSPVAIFGQGPVGLSATMLARARGARVIAVDIAETRLNRAREFGAVEVINPAKQDPVQAIHEITGGGAPLVLETSGASEAMGNAIRSLGPWGRACFVGIGGSADFNVREFLPYQITLLISWSMSIVGLRQCAAFAAQQSLPVDALFSHRWKLDQAAEAYEEFDQQSAGKGVFVF